MEQNPFEFHRRAFFKFHALPPEDQAAINEALEQLAKVPSGEWGERGVKRLEYDPTLSLFPIGPSVRIVFQDRDKGLPEVADIYRQETLDGLLQTTAKQKNE